MIKVARVWVMIIALPTILILMVNITNKILNENLINSLWTIMWYVDQILWTQNTNYILIWLSIILLVKVIRRIYWFITWNNDN